MDLTVPTHTRVSNGRRGGKEHPHCAHVQKPSTMAASALVPSVLYFPKGTEGVELLYLLHLPAELAGHGIYCTISKKLNPPELSGAPGSTASVEGKVQLVPIYGAMHLFSAPNTNLCLKGAIEPDIY